MRSSWILVAGIVIVLGVSYTRFLLDHKPQTEWLYICLDSDGMAKTGTLRYESSISPSIDANGDIRANNFVYRVKEGERCFIAPLTPEHPENFNNNTEGLREYPYGNQKEEGSASRNEGGQSS